MIKTTQAKEVLENLLHKANFDKDQPNLDIIVDVYKEFSKIKVDCASDDFLFQCGVFDFTGERLFYWDIVRQFMIEEKNCYSHMEQLHFEAKFEPNTELEDLLTVEWSTGDLDQYFDDIASSMDFTLPFHKYVPRSIDIYQERV